MAVNASMAAVSFSACSLFIGLPRSRRVGRPHRRSRRAYGTLAGRGGPSTWARGEGASRAAARVDGRHEGFPGPSAGASTSCVSHAGTQPRGVSSSHTPAVDESPMRDQRDVSHLRLRRPRRAVRIPQTRQRPPPARLLCLLAATPAEAATACRGAPAPGPTRPRHRLPPRRPPAAPTRGRGAAPNPPIDPCPKPSGHAPTCASRPSRHRHNGRGRRGRVEPRADQAHSRGTHVRLPAANRPPPDRPTARRSRPVSSILT